MSSGTPTKPPRNYGRIKKNQSPNTGKATSTVVSEANLRLLWLYHLASGMRPNHQLVAEHFQIPYKTANGRFARLRDYFKDVEIDEEAMKKVKSTTKKTKASATPKSKAKSKAKKKENDSDEDAMDEDIPAGKKAPSKRAPGHSLQQGEGEEDDDIELDDDDEYRYPEETEEDIA